MAGTWPSVWLFLSLTFLSSPLLSLFSLTLGANLVSSLHHRLTTLAPPPSLLGVVWELKVPIHFTKPAFIVCLFSLFLTYTMKEDLWWWCLPCWCPACCATLLQRLEVSGERRKGEAKAKAVGLKFHKTCEAAWRLWHYSNIHLVGQGRLTEIKHGRLPTEFLAYICMSGWGGSLNF